MFVKKIKMNRKKHFAKYVDYYNTQRLHSSLFYLTLDDYVNIKSSRLSDFYLTNTIFIKK